MIRSGLYILSAFSLVFLLLFRMCSIVYGAFEQGFSGARQDALGGSFTSVADDGFAGFYNPAGICQLSKASLSAAYARPFGLKELNHYSGVVVFPIGNSHFAGAWKTVGFSLYREQWVQLSSGFYLLPRLAVGGTLKYFNLSIARYGSRNSMNGDVGLLYSLNDRWRIGGSICNVIEERIGNTVLTRRRGSFGVSYQFNRYGFIVVDERMEAGSRLAHSLGVEINLQENICFRFGYQEQSEIISGGLGLFLKSHRVDYAVIHHAVLGYTHSISLTFELSH